jgi:hypothetical protein
MHIPFHGVRFFACKEESKDSKKDQEGSKEEVKPDGI